MSMGSEKLRLRTGLFNGYSFVWDDDSCGKGEDFGTGRDLSWQLDT